MDPQRISKRMKNVIKEQRLLDAMNSFKEKGWYSSWVGRNNIASFLKRAQSNTLMMKLTTLKPILAR